MLPFSSTSLVRCNSKYALIVTVIILSACGALLAAYRQLEQIEQNEITAVGQQTKAMSYNDNVNATATLNKNPISIEWASMMFNLSSNSSRSSLSSNIEDKHFTNDSFLDLLDWEVSSMQALVDLPTNKNSRTAIDASSCSQALPPGVPVTCCVGRITYKRDRCIGLSLRDYQSVRDYALQHHMLPLPRPSHDDIGNGQSPTVKASSSGMKCDLCQIMDLLHDHNITLGIYGDSVTSQMAELMECGLLRRGYNVSANETSSSSIVYSVSSNATVSGTRPWTHAVKIHVYRQYRILPDLHLHSHAPGNDPDVNALLLSFGLHWGAGPSRPRKSPQDYYGALTRLFQYIKNVTTTRPIKFFAWRETSAQHFDGNGGDYYHYKAKYPNGTTATVCVAMNATESNHSSAGWREPIVQAAAQSTGFQVVPVQDLPLPKSTQPHVTEFQGLQPLIVLPFFNYTAGLHYLHPLYTGDCTHYCQVPYLFWPLWRSLRIALENGI